MRDRAFLDTNVFVYSLDQGAPERKRVAAQYLIESSIGSRSGVVSFQVIHELVNVVVGKMKPRLDIARVREYLDAAPLRMIVAQPSFHTVERALDLLEARRISWYDALIVSAAVEADCSALYTEDLQDGMKFGRLKVVNPFRVH